MPQFDLYRNPSRRTSQARPFLLDVQADLLRDYPTRAVVPLTSTAEIARRSHRLNPTFIVEGKAMVMMTMEIASVPVHILRDRVASLEDCRTDIVAALDFLLTGV